MSALATVDFDKGILPVGREAIREFITNVEKEFSQYPQIEIPVEHFFTDSNYARKIEIKAGTLITGAIHKKKTLNIIMTGEVSVLSIDGILNRQKAPFVFISSPGAKRVIYAHQDSIWMTTHGTKETDLAKIEEEFIAKSYDEIEETL